MDEERITKLTKKILSNCVIYPKAQPRTVKKEIKKNELLLNMLNSDISNEDEFVNKISKSLDVKQRIEQEGSWIKYVEQ